MKNYFLILAAFLGMASASKGQNSNAGSNAQNSSWKNTGNNALNSDFIGTTNSTDLTIKTNNTIRGKFDAAGNFIFDGGVNGDKEFIIHPAGITNPIASYMLKVGGGGYFERSLVVKEFVTVLKSLHSPSINVDSIKMDSTRGIYGKTRVFGDLKLNGDLSVSGNATIEGVLTGKQGLMLNSTTGFRASLAPNGISTIISYGKATNPYVLPLNPCLAPKNPLAPGVPQNIHQIGGMIQLFDDSNGGAYNPGGSVMNLQSWSTCSSIDVQGGQPSGGLLINYFCGKDVAMCTGSSGGVVGMGKNVEIGGPGRDLGVALNLNSLDKTGAVISSSFGNSGPGNYVTKFFTDRSDANVLSIFNGAQGYQNSFNVLADGTTYLGGSLTTKSLSGQGTRTVLVDNTGKLIFGTATTPSASAWVLGGNSISSSSTDFIGTLTAQPFNIWAGGVQQISVRNDGKTVVGSSNLTINDKFNITDVAPTGMTLFADGLTAGLANESRITIANQYGAIKLYQDENGFGHLSSNGSNMVSFKGEGIFIGEPDGAAYNFGDIYTKLTISTKSLNFGNGTGFTQQPLKILNPDLSSTNKTVFEILPDGTTHIGALRVAQGSIHENAMLTVGGEISAKSLFVLKPTNWADYVFENDYKLLSLQEIKTYVNKEKHLPDVPSTDEIMANGYDVNSMDKMLLEKIEALYLYVIKQDEEIKDLKSKLNRQ
ncbi:MAG: hypothetical protein ACJ76F_05905 [Bacteroidia bacterium]